MSLYKYALKPWTNWETVLWKHIVLPMFQCVSQRAQIVQEFPPQVTLGKHRVNESSKKHFYFPAIFSGLQERKHRESRIFPRQCFLVCPRI